MTQVTDTVRNGVDTQRLYAGHCGHLLTAAFLKSLPEGVDPCGERGEYHTFVYDGPAFRRPVPFALGELHPHAPFLFQELLPGGAGVHQEERQAAQV